MFRAHYCGIIHLQPLSATGGTDIFYIAKLVEHSMALETLTRPTEEVCDLFREGYGTHYDAEKAQRIFMRATRIFMLRDLSGCLVAGVVAEESRIAAAATTTNTSRGKRLELGLRIMAICREDLSTYWSTVGEQHRAVQLAAGMAGMERIQDPEQAATILNDYGRGDEYAVCDATSGLLISTQSSSAECQQLWAWPEKIPASSM